MVDVGALSSDHDRACEAFYQLYGGQVDYGEVHSHEAKHNRFGDTFENPMHSTWSASNPIHLVGHSFGGTTAIELYQLLCSDFFGVGSDSRWVVSLVSIASPLSGSTVSHLFGLHDLHMVPYSPGHFIGSALGVWFKLHTDWSLLRHVFDFRMPQWRCVNTFREILSPTGRINGTNDLAVYNILPRERMRRNAQLIDMDKIFLVSVATSSHVTMPRVEVFLTILVVVCAINCALMHTETSTLSISALCASFFILWRRLRALDYASIPSLYCLLLIMRRHVRTLHMIFDGFDRELWGDNDGAVNLYSMLQPWASDSDTESTTSNSSHSSLTVDLATTSSPKKDMQQNVSNDPQDLDPLDSANLSKLRRGHWYVHRVEKNHLAGTHFDSDSPKLFQRLFPVLAHFETARTF
ncbi:uncharacterized protein PHALS_07138 [Plasmopara halstedii]|uniref:Lipase-like C-terminal domain-containing protein n=1 Tax=Plasmopara halstedii TaxID=4781 RepID=A0A0P1B3Q6_PLAHL|nr:uncharacterized protein PHALS_07138 [Plasmopara halstedii]CEG49373.1 hypothetical protein PHALS_07138 [Plasmopara halstedii]|eukprot:XP_024585742.1 hypothetical protein PHALS_07138 [Plasmopara halstedii]